MTRDVPAANRERPVARVTQERQHLRHGVRGLNQEHVSGTRKLEQFVGMPMFEASSTRFESSDEKPCDLPD
jgi:hypothetical protein